MAVCGLFTYAIIIFFAFSGLIFTVVAARRLIRLRVISAGASGLSALVLIAAAGFLAAVAVNLQTYSQLTHERNVAEIVFKRTAPGRYLAELLIHDTGERRLFALAGDSWQIDARILKWRGPANLMGLDSLYRLERLSGRYDDIERERRSPRTVYALAEDPGLDLWKLTRRFKRWLPWVDARYGSATYLPMADRARFSVFMTQSGLLARPRNEPARTSVDGWFF